MIKLPDIQVLVQSEVYFQDVLVKQALLCERQMFKGLKRFYSSKKSFETLLFLLLITQKKERKKNIYIVKYIYF